MIAAARNGDEHAFNVCTVAADPEPILSQGFIPITPEYTIATCPPPDIIVFPGGDQRQSATDPRVIAWIQEASEHAEVVLSL